MKQHTLPIRVYYENTDCGGIVYHTDFIQFCERARSELFFKKNQLPMQNGIGFVVKDIKASFLAPAFLGDLLEVRTELVSSSRASLDLLQEIYLLQSLQEQKRSANKLFSMQVKLVCMASVGKIVKIPKELLELLSQ